MRRIFQFTIVAFFSLGLFGCPYESQIPISKPSIPVDTRLLGKWTSKDEVYNTYTVSKASETEYKILQKNIASTSKFIGYLSQLKGNTFINLFSDSTQTFYLYRIIFDQPDKFSLIPVANNLPAHFGSMEALKDYFEKNMNFQSFYNESDKAEFVKDQPNKPTALN